MTRAEPELLVDEVLPAEQTAIVMSQAAILVDPPLGSLLAQTAKKDSGIQADAIEIQHVGNRLYVASSNDD